MTDLKAARGELGASLGPIGQACRLRGFSAVHLLSDHASARTKEYADWLASQMTSGVAVHPATLSGPTEFGEIYEAAIAVVGGVLASTRHAHIPTYHLSPGTPAMAAVWMLIAKTVYPAELIESSPETGVRTVSLPFDIAAEYKPAPKRPQDDQILRLTQGLPPETPEFAEIIHSCKPMKRVLAQARRLALHGVPVLIQGESGTGKELLARAIHTGSERKGGRFVEVNCGAIPSELIESEFFGHKKGAFTGAVDNRAGHFETANGGTLFLDEIGELPLAAQVRLLRALQEKKIQRVGDSKLQSVDVRVIAATNRNLLEEVRAGRFREDLFHRIAVGVLQLPPVRERRGDVTLLIDWTLAKLNKDSDGISGWKDKKLSPGARNLLLQHPWPGNVRELINTLSRALIWTTNDTVDADDIREALLPTTVGTGGETILNRPLGEGLDLRQLLSDVAIHYLKRAMLESEGNKRKAAGLLGLPNYQTLTNWLEKYGVQA
jgi:transcriptional regulator with PAS, ATPase and Fis domain